MSTDYMTYLQKSMAKVKEIYGDTGPYESEVPQNIQQ
jgi:hypothetical protein